MMKATCHSPKLYAYRSPHVSRTNKHFRLTTIALTRKEEEAFQDGDEGEM
jgi:hypothetical protein